MTARELLDQADGVNTLDRKRDLIATAHVEAILELAEQQRAGNLIAQAIPPYAMLDVWMALYGTSHPDFDEFYAEHGYAETWARLMHAIRHPQPTEVEQQSLTAAHIAEAIRRHCTPSSEAYEQGGDRLIAAVADWIEHPPAWVNAPWSESGHPQPTEREPSDTQRLVHEVNMMLSSVASHGPRALTDTDDPEYTARLLGRLRTALLAAARVADQEGEGR